MSATRSAGPLDVVAGALDDVVARLGGLAAELSHLWEGRVPARGDLAAYRPVIHDLLARCADLVSGAGVAIGPGHLSDVERHLEWWFTRANGGVEALRVNLDPSAPDYYDFTAEEWFVAAVRGGRPVAAGPVVDYPCTLDYALTVACPVVGGGSVVALAAADVPIERLEPRILPALAQDGRPWVLCNEVGRVILSTVATLSPGVRLNEQAGGPGTPLGRGPLAAWRLVEVNDVVDQASRKLG